MIGNSENCWQRLSVRPGTDFPRRQNGFEALLVIEKDVPAVVISDLDMPGMSGFELLSVLRRRHPEIAVICVTGEYEIAVPPPYIVCDAFFEKGRYSLADFRAKVAELVHSEYRAPIIPVPGAVV